MREAVATDLGAKWVAGIHKLFPTSIPESAQWTDILEFETALRPMLNSGASHIAVPTRGSVDASDCRLAELDDGCIEFIKTPESAFVVRPKRLSFEHFDRAPEDSFLHLELETLAPSGAYEDTNGRYEECVLTENGE